MLNVSSMKTAYGQAGEMLNAMISDRLGEASVKHRNREGINQEDFGKRVWPERKSTQNKISDLENPKHPPLRMTIEDFYRLCMELGLQPDRVLSSELDKLPERLKKTKVHASNPAATGAM